MNITPTIPYLNTLESGKTLNIDITVGTVLIEVLIDNVSKLKTSSSASKKIGPFVGNVDVKVVALSGTAEIYESDALVETIVTHTAVADITGVGVERVGAAIYVDGVSTKHTANNTFVLFGDSITSRCNPDIKTIPTAISRTGDVVTVTSSPHQVYIGTTLKIANLMPDDFNGIVTVDTVASSGVFTYVKAGAQGAAVITGTTHPSGAGMEIKVLDGLVPTGFWLWVNGLMKGGLDLVMNCGRNSWEAAYMALTIADREAEIIATGRAAANAYIRMGINDITHDRTAAQVIASLTTIIQHNIDKGRRVFVETILPYGSGHAGFTAAHNATITQVNRWINSVAPALLGVIPIDTYTLTVIPATGAAKANVLSADFIHPTPVGQIDYMAPKIAAVFGKYIHTESILPTSLVDTVTANANSKNLMDIGPWVVTGGGPISGNVTPGTANVCLGLTVTEVGTSSEAQAQINTNAEGYIEQQVNLAGVLAAGNTSDISHALLVSKLAAGDRIKIALTIKLSDLDAAAGDIGGFGCWMTCIANGITYYHNIIGQDTPRLAFPLTGITAGEKTYEITSLPFLVPPLLTAFILHCKLEAKGVLVGNPATMKVSRIGMIKL
jgi:hypothetical protein